MLPPPQGRPPHPESFRSAGPLTLGLLALAAGCGGGDSLQPTGRTITLKAGDVQRAVPGTAVAIAPSVAVTDADANPVAGVPITFRVTAGGGSVTPAGPVNTDQQGTAAVSSWTLGPTAGDNRLSASGAGLTGSPIVFTATGLILGTITGTLTVSNELVATSARTAVARTRAAAPAVSKVRPLPAIRDLTGARAGQRPGSRPPRYSPDELIIRYRPGAFGISQRGAARAVSRAGAAALAGEIRTRMAPRLSARGSFITGISPVLLAARVRVGNPAAIGEVAAELRRDPAVASVERNGMTWGRQGAGGIMAPPSANDPLGPLQAWTHEMIDLPEAWALTTGSRSVLVAVVDDGIRFDHPDIAANLTDDGYDFVSNDAEVPLCSGEGTIELSGDGDGYDADPTEPSSYGYDPFEQCAFGPFDQGGHGLSVAGIIGAVGNDGTGMSGVNWAISIRPLRVLGAMGVGFNYDVAQGMLYAAGLPADDGAGSIVQAPTGARIINMSLGSLIDDPVMRDAVLAVTDAGALIVSGAGDQASSVATYPGAYPEVLTTSGLGPDRELASYSSFGPAVDIAAPAGDFADGDGSFGVLTAAWDFSAGAPTYLFYDGVSTATAHVSGVAALVLAQNPGLNPAELRARVTDYAVDAGPPGRDDQFGAGILNARNSLAGNLGPSRQLHAVLYDASSGLVGERVAAAGDGSYSIQAPVGSYQVYAGQDESGDRVIGLPGRRWGAFGGSARPSRVEVNGVETHDAPVTVGFPSELEPNGTMAEANTLPIGGYLTGVISTGEEDRDMFRVLIGQAGQYTFETSGVDGACGFALQEDTSVGLLRPDQTAVEGSVNLVEDIDPATNNLCSRVTAPLQPGTYYFRVEGSRGGSYRVQARSGA
jgi:hypothetical protein